MSSINGRLAALAAEGLVMIKGSNVPSHSPDNSAGEACRQFTWKNRSVTSEGVEAEEKTMLETFSQITQATHPFNGSM